MTIARSGLSRSEIPLAEVIAAIDARLRADPAGSALGYAEAMTRWLGRLRDGPSDELAIAVRGQHFERWKNPRDAYPRNRKGYLAWRRDAMHAQADRLAALLADKAIERPRIERISALVTKQNLATDAEAQTLEDCACLTFVERQWADFALDRPDDQLARIVKRTMAKMSAEAQSLLLASVDDELRVRLQRLIDG